MESLEHANNTELLSTLAGKPAAEALLEQYNLPVLQARAHFPGPFGIRVPGGVHNGKAGQKTLQVEPQVTLGGGFAAPVLGPSPDCWPPVGWLVESTRWIIRLKRNAYFRRRPVPKPGLSFWRCSNNCQNSPSAMAGSRSRLACERLLRLGAVAPRTADWRPECRFKATQTSLSPILWANWAKSSVTT